MPIILDGRALHGGRGRFHPSGASARPTPRSTMHRRTAAAAAAALLALTAGPAATAVAAPKERPAHTQKEKPTRPDKPAKARKVVAVYNGTLAAVDTAASTVTVDVKGGRDRDARRTTVTFVVPETATITRDELPATLADLVVGDAINVKTLTIGDGERTVTAVRATTPEVEEPVVEEPVVEEIPAI